MKHHKYLVILVILCTNIAACSSDFLDVVDKSVLTRQAYVRDLGSMKEFLNGTYELFNQYSVQGIGNAYPELIADNLKPLALPPQSLFLHYTWAQQKGDRPDLSESTGSVNMNGSWRSSYFIIRACNFIIEDIEKYRKENPDVADNIKGQAYALRALLYFKLVNIFAQTYKFTPNASHMGVPYITTSDVTQHYTRQSVAEVYNSIIADLNMAVQLLPEMSSIDIRYINNYAARALLARVYLFSGKYAQTRELSEKLCEQVPLLTIANGYPDGLFYHKNFVETEVLFQATPGDLYNSNFLGRYLRGTFSYYLATEDIASILMKDSNDVRSKWVTYSDGTFKVTKFPVNVAGMRTVPEADYYHPIIRSSEVYLMAAESCALLGDENKARDYLNAVRKRADPEISSLTIGGNELINAIWEERRKELSFEGMRMYDLQRWQQPVVRKDVLNNDWNKLPYPSDKAISPIPLQDVMLENLPQNIGY
ncbi:RagB/SusD family nutrient uptake outer membrane protein [Chitinophaga filiformis]|uniref:SusD family protein n=1 Tax=Chitinophaga filiformis TaxID=104663 RepID=A0A1G7UNS5_CHIFI|nr:RagB/SusD family nutrient uptake outer membrane protein [Chitinophaga filiformis]SDG48998.1 SusD family protein [Chitinophaga filiformis]